MSRLDGGRFNAVFFDVDGTLIDTAPDMVAVLQELLTKHGQHPVDHGIGRAHVSNGAVGLLQLGFPNANDDDIEQLRQEFLDSYAQRVCARSRVFDGLEALLQALDKQNVTWGVITNKPHALTVPLMEGLRLTDRAACIISGDTLPQRKPDPAQLLYACELVGVAAGQSLYIGDAERDIAAGRAARMSTIAAAYGYILPGDDPATWGADDVAADTQELAQIVRKAVNLDA